MNFVRPFEEHDAQPLAGLMLEMVRFYDAMIDPNLDIAEDIIRQSKTTDILVAVGEDGLLGFTTFASLYPVSGLIAFTYIQQIYVGLNGRRLGVGRLLMRAVARIAKARGSTRIEWSTGRENTAAQALSMRDWGRSGLTRCNTPLRGNPYMTSRLA